MRILIKILFTLLVLQSCNSNRQEKKGQPKSTVKSLDTIKSGKQITTDTKPILKNVASEGDSDRLNSLESEFKNFKLYNLTDTIKADLNGDNITDLAVFTEADHKKGILITDGQTKKQTKIGLGLHFCEMGDDFSWVDFWGTTSDKEIYEMVIKDDEITGSRQVKLQGTSLFVRKDEEGGGVITYKNNQFVWVHQAD